MIQITAYDEILSDRSTSFNVIKDFFYHCICFICFLGMAIIFLSFTLKKIIVEILNIFVILWR